MENLTKDELDVRLSALRASKDSGDVYKTSTPKESNDVAAEGELTAIDKAIAEIFVGLPQSETSYTRIYDECAKKGLGGICKAQVDAALFKAFAFNPIYDSDEVKKTAMQLYAMRYGANNYMYYAFNKRFDLLNTSELMVDGFIDLIKSTEECRNLGDITEFLDRAEEVVDPDEKKRG